MTPVPYLFFKTRNKAEEVVAVVKDIAESSVKDEVGDGINGFLIPAGILGISFVPYLSGGKRSSSFLVLRPKVVSNLLRN